MGHVMPFSMAMLNNQRVRMDTRQTSVLFGDNATSLPWIYCEDQKSFGDIWSPFLPYHPPFFSFWTKHCSSGSFTTPRRWFWNHPMLWWSWQSRFRWAKRLWIPRPSAQTPCGFIGWDLCQKLLHTEEGTMHRKRLRLYTVDIFLSGMRCSCICFHVFLAILPPVA